MAPRFGIGISDIKGEDEWYRGNFELLVETPLLFQYEPGNGNAKGGSLLLRYNFLPEDKFIPFVEIGGGIMFLDFDLEGLSSLKDSSILMNIPPVSARGHYIGSLTAQKEYRYDSIRYHPYLVFRCWSCRNCLRSVSG